LIYYPLTSFPFLDYQYRLEATLFRRTNGEIQYDSKDDSKKRGILANNNWGLEEGETEIEAPKRDVREGTGMRNIIKMHA